MAERVLIVEDETSVAEAIAYTLEQEGFEVEVAGDGLTALKRFEARPPELVILDLMLPGVSGWRLFSDLRQRRRQRVPVIMLTARAEEADRIAGLEMGADDYVTKPFSMRELTARVRAVLRRVERLEQGKESRTLSVAGISVDTDRREVIVDTRPVELSPKEFDLLAYMMKNAGLVLTREQIYSAVWGEDPYLDERTVDVHVHWLRKKIEPNPAKPRRLVTARGVGYKFVDAA